MGNELLPWFWGWVLTRVKNFVGNRFPGKGLFSDMCVLGLHGSPQLDLLPFFTFPWVLGG